MSAASDPNTNLVWIDLEMTGLEAEKCKIVEIACLVTNKDLEVLAEGPDLVIHRTPEELEVMVEKVAKMHAASGLTKQVQESTITDAQAEEQVLNFIKKYVNPEVSPLCGNTLYWDRNFIEKYMPLLSAHLSHRHIDVSTVKELYKRWTIDPELMKKGEGHRAMDDIRESVAELQYYRDIEFIGG